MNKNLGGNNIDYMSIKYYGFKEEYLPHYKNLNHFNTEKYEQMSEEQKEIFISLVDPFYSRHINYSYNNAYMKQLFSVLNFCDPEVAKLPIELSFELYRFKEIIFSLGYYHIGYGMILFTDESKQCLRDLMLLQLSKMKKPTYQIDHIDYYDERLDSLFTIKGQKKIMEEIEELSKTKEYKRYNYYFKKKESEDKKNEN